MPGREWHRIVPLVLLMNLTLALHHKQNIEDEITTETTVETSTGLSTETSDILQESSTSSSDEPSPTSPSDEPSQPSSTTSTILPSLSEKELFQETGAVLDNLTASLDDLLEVANGRGLRPPYHSKATTRSTDQRTYFCTDPDDDLCTDLYNNLNHTEYLVGILVDKTNTWDEIKLLELTRNSIELQISTIAVEANDDFLNNVDNKPFQEYVTTVRQAVVVGREVARDIVRSIQKRERDSVVLVAVVASLGIVMMVIPVVGIALIYFKSAQAKKASQVLEHGHHTQTQPDRLHHTPSRAPHSRTSPPAAANKAHYGRENPRDHRTNSYIRAYSVTSNYDKTVGDRMMQNHRS